MVTFIPLFFARDSVNNFVEIFLLFCRNHLFFSLLPKEKEAKERGLSSCDPSGRYIFGKLLLLG